MTMKELCSNFLSLLCYVPYVIDNPKTLEGAIRKTNFCYDQNKNKNDSIYLIEKIKDVKVLNRKRKAQNFIKILEIIIEVIKEVILKIINNIIILQQKKEKCPLLIIKYCRNGTIKMLGMQ